MRIYGYDQDEQVLVQFDGKHQKVPVTVMASTDSQEDREPPHKQRLFDLKSFFRERNCSCYLNIINIGIAGKGKRRLHANYLK